MLLQQQPKNRSKYAGRNAIIISLHIFMSECRACVAANATKFLLQLKVCEEKMWNETNV